MEYPHGHHHHHHHGPEREEERYPPPAYPPPPSYYGDEPPPPPPPQVTHVYHSSYTEMGGEPDYYPPPPPPYVGPGYGYARPPPPAAVEHVSHHSHTPHFPSFVHHQTHHSETEFAYKPTVRVYTKAAPNYSLSILDGKVILARSNPSDPFQHWFKDETYSTRVKDEEGYPSFALVNKATGQAMKHSTGPTHPVHLIPYKPNHLDESILWADKDLGDGFRVIRMVNNIRLNLDAFHGDDNHGGVHDGTKIVLWEWKKGDNQRWKIVPYYSIKILPEERKS